MTGVALSHAELADAFRAQARGCALTGSPIYGALLERAADDVARGGLFADLVSSYRGVPMLDALPLRVQTNEVQRSAVLVPGFLRMAARTGLPLRIREIGSSAGLNLFFDRYRYELGPHRIGDAASPLALAARWDGAPPDLEATLRVASRRGCDVAPLDVRDPAHRLRLESFVWPEQLDRLARLRAALEVAVRAPPAIDAEPAGAWLETQLGERAPGAATVLFHSVVWWYIAEPERARITRAMESAGERATRAAPLAWLRMEGSRLEEAELRLRLWPDGEDVLLARVHWHGAEVRWLG